ncbi:hypothetical protein K501DRAFT_101232 [Backusella circina FSU 941]|nr:hypothetical protein K501DRAFT_101232 [Backusella circina FSU 941]
MNNVDLSCHEVTWEDTDSSEDEDYLPQHPFQEVRLPSIKYYINTDRKRGRMNSMDIETRDLFKRRVNEEEPRDKVRKVLDATIDNGIEEVDLSKMNLVDIPDDIVELQYVTVVQNDVVKAASLQLYLYSNQIEDLCPSLFKLRNLTVLSLRNNRLTNIPVEIALLENLVELALGNNQLVK